MNMSKAEEYIANPQTYVAKLFRTNCLIGELLLGQISDKERGALTEPLRSIAVNYVWKRDSCWRFMDSHRQVQVETDLRMYIQRYVVELQLIRFEELVKALPLSWQRYEAVDNNCTNALRGKHVFVQAEDPAWGTRYWSMLPTYYVMRAEVVEATYPNLMRVNLIYSETLRPWGSNHSRLVKGPETVLYTGDDIHVEEVHGMPEISLYERRTGHRWLPWKG